MNCIKKKAMFITAGFLGIGGYILYQNLKSRIDDLEEEIWGMEDSELEDCPYCDKVYTMEYETYNDFTKNTDEIILENVKMLQGNKDEQIADVMTDGCDMGIKSIARYLNKYPASLPEIKELSFKSAQYLQEVVG